MTEHKDKIVPATINRHTVVERRDLSLWLALGSPEFAGSRYGHYILAKPIYPLDGDDVWDVDDDCDSEVIFLTDVLAIARAIPLARRLQMSACPIPALVDLCAMRENLRWADIRAPFSTYYGGDRELDALLLAFSRLTDLDDHRVIMTAALAIVARAHGVDEEWKVSGTWHPISCQIAGAIRIATDRFAPGFALTLRNDGTSGLGVTGLTIRLSSVQVASLLSILWSHQIDGGLTLTAAEDQSVSMSFSIVELRQAISRT